VTVPPNTYYADSTFQTDTITQDEDDTRVRLPREDLLKYTSQEYDDYVKRISLKRPLSEKEHRESKKQRRLIKNREYAQISRNKKKNEYAQLSVQIDQLNQHNTELMERVSLLEAENKRLKEENRQMIDFYNQRAMTPPSSTSPPEPSLSLSDVLLNQPSPPLTPTSSDPGSSEDSSSSFDIFNSEDISDDIFTNDWQSMSKFPIGFMAVFFCLLLFFPSSMFQPAVIPNTVPPSPEQKTVKDVPVVQSKPVGIGRQRYLLNTEADQPINSNNEWNTSSKSLSYISIEDVLNDEMISINPYQPLVTNTQDLTLKHDNVFHGIMSNQSMFIERTPHVLFGSF